MHGRNNQMPLKGLLLRLQIVYPYQQGSFIFLKDLIGNDVCYTLFQIRIVF